MCVMGRALAPLPHPWVKQPEGIDLKGKVSDPEGMAFRSKFAIEPYI